MRRDQNIYVKKVRIGDLWELDGDEKLTRSINNNNIIARHFTDEIVGTRRE